jgi:hypothetical protein
MVSLKVARRVVAGNRWPALTYYLLGALGDYMNRVSISLHDLDPLDRDSVERACDLLWALHASLLEAERRLGQSREEILAKTNGSNFRVSEPALSESTSAEEEGDGLSLFGSETRQVLRLLRDRAHASGSSTLEEVSEELSLPIESVRAFMRNAGRTAKHHGIELPVRKEWNPDRRVMQYYV